MPCPKLDSFVKISGRWSRQRSRASTAIHLASAFEMDASLEQGLAQERVGQFTCPAGLGRAQGGGGPGGLALAHAADGVVEFGVDGGADRIVIVTGNHFCVPRGATHPGQAIDNFLRNTFDHLLPGDAGKCLPQVEVTVQRRAALDDRSAGIPDLGKRDSKAQLAG